ncbi:MAG: hypothetical protein HYY65_06260 [Candidatus Tectomicrobia bacterium]|uniref:Uncharacterized protein n=1 Tax=Tectimicrobiota bacterium TaxID=2528274 RepID=A0A932GPA3_UNCTE|nr:hypothetical protein [Candidatus Tectomicrobia bacterium]
MKPGERALLVVNSFYDQAVVDAIVQAIRKLPGKVDLISVDMGPDRPLNYTDELLGFMHNCPGVPEVNEVRQWIERVRWAEEVAERGEYDILIHTLGGSLPAKKFRYGGIPWTSREVFPAADFPYEVWDAINHRAWDQIWNKGRGGKVRLTDPEGTDITFTFPEESYDLNRYAQTKSLPLFQEKPFFGHLFGRPTPPYERSSEDASGVVAGTINHISSPFPRIKLHIEGGKAVRIEEGGKYGDAWRELLDIGKKIRYPEYPSEGLFWWWELAIGTNPKMRRPSNAFMLSGAGALSERLRSGIIHIGIGTVLYGPSENWAEEKKHPYGHMHVHLLFPTYEIICRDGKRIKVVDNGHLTALDDPEVVALAAKYGDPKEILREEWIPPVPGISVPGDYWQDYAREPRDWLDKHKEVI